MKTNNRQSMIKVFSGLYERYFSEEEALIFTLLLVAGTVIMLTMGGVIAPLLWAMVLTFMLQGLVNSLVKINVPRRISVYLVYVLFLGVTLIIFLFFSLSAGAGFPYSLKNCLLWLISYAPCFYFYQKTILSFFHKPRWSSGWIICRVK